MSDKYVIRNCPEYDDYFNPNETCRKRYSQYCQDCNDCLLKKIVDKCKDKIRIYGYYDKDYALGQVKCAEAILELLDIKEILE